MSESTSSDAVIRPARVTMHDVAAALADFRADLDQREADMDAAFARLEERLG